MDNKQKEGSIKNYFESLIDEKLKIKGKTELNILVLLSHNGHSDLKYLLPIISKKSTKTINLTIIRSLSVIDSTYTISSEIKQFEHIQDLENNNNNEIKFDIVFSLFFLHKMVNWELAMKILYKHMKIGCKFIIAKTNNPLIECSEDLFYKPNIKLDDETRNLVGIIQKYNEDKLFSFGSGYFKSVSQSNIENFILKIGHYLELKHTSKYNLETQTIDNWSLDSTKDKMNSYYISPFYGSNVIIENSVARLTDKFNTIFINLNSNILEINKQLNNIPIEIYELDFFNDGSIYKENNLIVDNLSDNFKTITKYIDDFNNKIDQNNSIKEDSDRRKKTIFLQNILYNQLISKHTKFFSLIILDVKIEDNKFKLDEKEIKNKKELFTLYPIEKFEHIYYSHIKYFQNLISHKINSIRETFIEFNNEINNNTNSDDNFNLIIKYEKNITKCKIEKEEFNRLKFIIFSFPFIETKSEIISTEIEGEGKNNSGINKENIEATLLKNFYLIETKPEIISTESEGEGKEISKDNYNNTSDFQIQILKKVIESINEIKVFLDNMNLNNSSKMAIVYITNNINLGGMNTHTNGGFLFSEDEFDITELKEKNFKYLRYQLMKDSLNYFTEKEILPNIVSNMVESNQKMLQEKAEKDKHKEEAQKLEGFRNFANSITKIVDKVEDLKLDILDIENNVNPKGKGIFGAYQTLGILFDYNVDESIYFIDNDTSFSLSKTEVNLSYIIKFKPFHSVYENSSELGENNWNNFIIIIKSFSFKFNYKIIKFFINNLLMQINKNIKNKAKFFMLLKYLIHRTYNPRYYEVSDKKYSLIYVSQIICLIFDVNEYRGESEIIKISYNNSLITKKNLFDVLFNDANLLIKFDGKDEHPNNSGILSFGRPIDFLNSIYLLLRDELNIGKECFAEKVEIIITGDNLLIKISCIEHFPINLIKKEDYSKSGLSSCIKNISKTLGLLEPEIVNDKFKSNSSFQIYFDNIKNKNGEDEKKTYISIFFPILK